LPVSLIIKPLLLGPPMAKRVGMGEAHELDYNCESARRHQQNDPPRG
jgi:hypothetical protein